jgi:glycerol uptake facilitator-like aquaporin
MFAALGVGSDGTRGGALLTAVVLFAFPLTGAALNPARWFGPVCWEYVSWNGTGPNPWLDALTFVAGPILGALAGGMFCFRFLAATIASKK